MIYLDCTETVHIVWSDVEDMPVVLNPDINHSEVEVSRVHARFHSTPANGYNWRLVTLKVTGKWTHVSGEGSSVDLNRTICLYNIEHLAGTWLYNWVRDLMKDDPVLKLDMVVG